MRAIRAIHGWGGHTACLPASGTLGRTLRFRDMDWWCPFHGALGYPQHLQVAAPQARAPLSLGGPLFHLFPNWATKAQGREFWRASLPHFLRTCSGTLGVRNSKTGPRMPVPADATDRPDCGSPAPAACPSVSAWPEGFSLEALAATLRSPFLGRVPRVRSYHPHAVAGQVGLC